MKHLLYLSIDIPAIDFYLKASSLYLLQIANADFATLSDGGEVITSPRLAAYNGTETHLPYHKHHPTLLISQQGSFLHCFIQIQNTNTKYKYKFKYEIQMQTKWN